MNTLFLALIASVSARNFLVNEGIERVADAVGAYHAQGVDAASASGIASSLIGQYVDSPPISSFVEQLVHEAEQKVLGAGGISNVKVDPALALDVMEKYKGAFSAFRAQPDFEAFKKAVAAAYPKFDSKRILAEGQQIVKQVNARGDVKNMYQSFTAAPSGKQALSSAQALYDLHNQVFNLHLPAFSMWLNLI